MKVKELQTELESLDPDAEIIIRETQNPEFEAEYPLKLVSSVAKAIILEGWYGG